MLACSRLGSIKATWEVVPLTSIPLQPQRLMVISVFINKSTGLIGSLLYAADTAKAIPSGKACAMHLSTPERHAPAAVSANDSTYVED